MKPFRSLPIAEQLKLSGTLIRNAQRIAEIKGLMFGRGYDAAALAEGVAVLAAAVSAVDSANEAAGDVPAASVAMQLAEGAAREAYRDYAQTCRTIFRRDKPSRELLGLVGAEPRRQADFELAARRLYNSTAYTPVITTKTAAQGYDADRLTEERGLIDLWHAARDVFKELSGTSERATELQRVAIRDLVEWVTEYIRLARIQFRKRPDLLEKLGIKMRNERTPAQRAGVRKAAETRRRNAAAKKAA